MTSKKDPVDLDAYACILHSAERGVSFEEYMTRVADRGRKKIGTIQRGLEE
jgi:hypothetical protein